MKNKIKCRSVDLDFVVKSPLKFTKKKKMSVFFKKNQNNFIKC